MGSTAAQKAGPLLGRKCQADAQRLEGIFIRLDELSLVTRGVRAQNCIPRI